MRLLLCLPSKLPVKGSVSNKPTGIANKMPPNWASFKCIWVLIDGMRDAQDEYPNPERKKKTALAKRNCRGVRVRILDAAVI